jgi:glycerophosphoryl diester phosphodiesterase
MAIKLIGHRGNGRTTETPFAEGKAPQQTLTSFAEAVTNGAEGVEFDVFITRDRVPVVIDRDTAFGRTVSQTNAAELQKISAAGNATIPTLEETLSLLQKLNEGRAANDKLFINIELKGQGVVMPTLSIVDGMKRQYGFDKDMIHYSAIDHDKLALVRSYDRDAHIQPTILTWELFKLPHRKTNGFFVKESARCDKQSLNKLKKFIRDHGCSAIDTPTADIRPQLLDMAADLNIGFCTHPTGPRRISEARRIFNNVSNLYAFSESTGNRVVLKVDDLGAARNVVAGCVENTTPSINAIERMMGVPFIRPIRKKGPDFQ